MAKKNKIVLLYPRLFTGKRTAWQRGAPLPILAVSAPLIAEGYDVVLINGDSDDGQDWIKEVVEGCRDAMLLGISSMSGPQIYYGLQAAKAVKNAGLKLPIIWGGYHPSILPEQTSQSTYVDAVVKGQGEITMLEVAGRISQGEDYTDVHGLTITRDGETISTPARKPVDINIFPRYPYEKLTNPEQYVSSIESTGSRTINYISSQGCPFKCQFCAEPTVYGGSWKSYKPDRVLSDLEFLKSYLRLNGIIFSDPNFFVKEKRAREISEKMIESRIDLSWLAGVKSSQIVKFSKESMEAFKGAGLKTFFIGAESGSDEMLQIIKKDIKPEDTIEATRLAVSYGFDIVFSFMVGFPGETERDVDRTCDLLQIITELMGEYSSSLSLYQPTPGNELYEKACQMGWRQPASLEEWSKYTTVVGHKHPWMEKKALNRIKQRDFYLNYGYSSRLLGRSHHSPYYRVAKEISSLRCRHKYWDFPLDWWLMRGLRQAVSAKLT